MSTKTINTRAIEVHKHRPVLLHINIDFEDGIVWKALVPLQYVLKGWGDANEGHQGYSHTISRNMQRVVRVDQIPSASERDKNDYYYVGITGRNWLQRLNEHFGEIRRGSGKRFHRAWRESLGIDDVLFTSSLLSVNMTKDEAMNWEEDKVETIAYGPNGLNMIPGGYKGLKYLHKLRIIKSFDISLEEREKAITEYMWQHPRKGVRNALLSELWKDDEFYKRVNKSHPKRLSEDQVLEIHRLNDMNWAASEIFKEVGAIDVNLNGGKLFLFLTGADIFFALLAICFFIFKKDCSTPCKVVLSSVNCDCISIELILCWSSA